MINISINLSKLPKGKISEAKNGDKWINLTVNENREIDKYGNSHHVIIQQTKEERTSKEAKVYVGNGKEFKFESTGTKPTGNGVPPSNDANRYNNSYDGGEETKDDLPF